MAYNLGELETARRYNDMHVPLVIVVNNNSSFAQGRPYFDDLSQIETPWINCCDLGELNFAKIAESFGCYGVRIERPGEIGDAIKNAFESNRIGVIDIVSDKREYPPLGWLREKIRKESAPKIPLY
jgi:acetolactate synthase-1/2/3 large subunit